jgi:hypothetical protein
LSSDGKYIKQKDVKYTLDLLLKNSSINKVPLLRTWKEAMLLLMGDLLIVSELMKKSKV